MALISSRSVVAFGSRTLLQNCRNSLSPNKFCIATLTSKELIDPNYKRPPPFPYETKNYNIWNWAVDSTLKRFNDNTKIIVVDGNIGAGKSALAKDLADAFDMKYVPEPDVSIYFKTPYGFDIRELNDILPQSYKNCTIDTFYDNPYYRNVTMMQFRMLVLRYIDYIDSFEHLLHSGQGIVMDRCVFGDIAFMEAMFRNGYFSEKARNCYLELYQSLTEHLFKPHLILYLDVAVPTALERIKERNRPSEVNSQVLTPKYLADIEHAQKQLYLKTLEKNCEVMVYDWSNFGDVEVVVDDMEKIDFDNYGKFDKKLKDWRQVPDDWEWGRLRFEYTTFKFKLYQYMNIWDPELPEILHLPDEQEKFSEIMSKVPGSKYAYGFNKDMGDSYTFKAYNSGVRDRVHLFPSWFHH